MCWKRISASSSRLGGKGNTWNTNQRNRLLEGYECKYDLTMIEIDFSDGNNTVQAIDNVSLTMMCAS